MQHATNTKNSNVASEGDQTLCNYKGVFLKSYRQIAVIFSSYFLVILRIYCLDCKVTNFSYICIGASYVFKHIFCNSNCKDNIKGEQKSSTSILFNLK